MNAVLSLSDGFEEIIKLLLPVSEQSHGVVVRERDALLTKLIDDERVCRLCIRECRTTQQEYEYKDITFQNLRSYNIQE